MNSAWSNIVRPPSIWMQMILYRNTILVVHDYYTICSIQLLRVQWLSNVGIVSNTVCERFFTLHFQKFNRCILTSSNSQCIGRHNNYKCKRQACYLILKMSVIRAWTIPGLPFWIICRLCNYINCSIIFRALAWVTLLPTTLVQCHKNDPQQSINGVLMIFRLATCINQRLCIDVNPQSNYWSPVWGKMVVTLPLPPPKDQCQWSSHIVRRAK